MLFLLCLIKTVLSECTSHTWIRLLLFAYLSFRFHSIPHYIPTRKSWVIIFFISNFMWNKCTFGFSLFRLNFESVDDNITFLFCFNSVVVKVLRTSLPPPILLWQYLFSEDSSSNSSSYWSGKKLPKSSLLIS